MNLAPYAIGFHYDGAFHFIYAEVKEAKSVLSHINYIKGIVQQLAVIGVDVEEQDVVEVLLSSLPQSYVTLITALGMATPPSAAVV